ncbi:MAG: DMT family transporter [Chitinophagales bacterium]
MIFLLLTIITSASLVLIFKVFDKYQVPLFPAIVVNYLAATISAFIFLPDKSGVTNGSLFSHNWIPLAMGLGALFITIFNMVSITTVRFGVSTASVAMKLGLVLPVLLAFTLYGEPFNWFKLLGIILAFVAVILSSIKEETEHHEHSKLSVLLPLLVFLGSGAADALTQLANKQYVSKEGMEEFSFFLFLAAAIAGVVGFIIGLIRKQTSLPLKSIIGGTILGVINYFSYFFMLKALASVNWGSSVLFPVINLGTVAFATIVGVLLFREKISKTNLAGLLFAAASISVILLSGK